MHLPTVVYLAPAAVCVLSWLGAGLLLPRRSLPGEPLLDWMTRIGVGAVVVALVLFGLGRLDAFDRWVVVVLTVAAAAAGGVALPRVVQDVRAGLGGSLGGRVGGVLLAAIGAA